MGEIRAERKRARYHPEISDCPPSSPQKKTVGGQTQQEEGKINQKAGAVELPHTYKRFRSVKR